MTSPLETLILSLRETRAKVEAALRRDEAFLALEQLDQREASGLPLSAVAGPTLRQRLTAELAGNRFMVAKQKLDEALMLLQARGELADAEAAEAPAPPTMAPTAAPPTSDIDDLCRIPGLEPIDRIGLAEAGVLTFDALARWSEPDIARHGHRFGGAGRPIAGRWVAQAVRLRDGQALLEPAPIVEAATLIAAAEPPVIVEVASDFVASDFAAADFVASEPEPEPPPTRIFTPRDVRGIDADAAVALAGLGFDDLAKIAALDAVAVACIDDALGVKGRVARQGWIEQAAILATGRATAHAAHCRRAVPVVASPAGRLVPMPIALGTPAPDEAPGEIVVIPAATTILIEALPPEELAIDPPAPEPIERPRDAPLVELAPDVEAAAPEPRPATKPSRRLGGAGDDFAEIEAAVAATVAMAENLRRSRIEPFVEPAAAAVAPEPAAIEPVVAQPARQRIVIDADDWSAAAAPRRSADRKVVATREPVRREAGGGEATIEFRGGPETEPRKIPAALERYRREQAEKLAAAGRRGLVGRFVRALRGGGDA